MLLKSTLLGWLNFLCQRHFTASNIRKKPETKLQCHHIKKLNKTTNKKKHLKIKIIKDFL